jgi:pyruvate dehydrogenase E1 component beta subunit
VRERGPQWAAKDAQRVEWHEVKVVDLRSIRPLDEQTILDSVRKTHRAVVVEENKPFCGMA